MSDNDGQQNGATPDDGQQGQQQGQQSGDQGQQQDTTDWKAEARKWQTRATNNKQKADQFDELQRSTQTEQQRAVEDAVKSATTPLQQENARLRVAIAKQLPADLIDRLRGETAEELEADADKLLELVKPAKQDPPSFNGGARTPAAGTSMNDTIRQLIGR